ncbi:MAG: response regulator transcription factor [Deltaproteobacteria bacterium]|nr:response regulator transcription factor [Deltaproteobacteria bacterium]
MKIRVLVADDHKITREGLINMLKAQPGIEVVGDAEDGRAAAALARKLKPDVVIMDVSMPDLNGMDATRKITAGSGEVKVIALSMYSDKRYVTGMIRAGARGYLLKDCSFEELMRAVRAVARNQAYLSPQVTSVMIDELLERGERSREPLNKTMTLREREILQLIAEGMTTTEIARHLNLSVKTVESHRRQLMEKAGVHSVAALTKFAIKEGLTSTDT